MDVRSFLLHIYIHFACCLSSSQLAASGFGAMEDYILGVLRRDRVAIKLANPLNAVARVVRDTTHKLDAARGDVASAEAVLKVGPALWRGAAGGGVICRPDFFSDLCPRYSLPSLVNPLFVVSHH